MEVFRCLNAECKQPILFEGDFIGVVRKICPKCKKMNVFKKINTNKLEKICEVKNN